MKIIAIAALACFGFASCKKDYTCTCTAADGSVSASSVFELHSTKSQAKSACEKFSGPATSGTLTTNVSCSVSLDQ